MATRTTGYHTRKATCEGRFEAPPSPREPIHAPSPSENEDSMTPDPKATLYHTVAGGEPVPSGGRGFSADTSGVSHTLFELPSLHDDANFDLLDADESPMSATCFSAYSGVRAHRYGVRKGPKFFQVRPLIWRVHSKRQPEIPPLRNREKGSHVLLEAVGHEPMIIPWEVGYSSLT
ncbi:hypothetical protein B0H13DRAFT_1880892 [Mycena leptocephala]|nr:hypothetical protein B0H13DRAFT_1880892 [Mycena leptocephala]